MSRPGLRALLDELEARASLSWPTRVVPASAVRQISLDSERAALAATAPSRSLGAREIVAARGLLKSDRRRELEVDPEPIDVEVLLALPPAEAFQLRQLLAVRPSLARGSEEAWLRVDRAILARHGLEAASVVSGRIGSALFVRDVSLVPAMVAATRMPQTRSAALAWLSRYADLAAGWAVRAALAHSQDERDVGAALLAWLFHEASAEAVETALARAAAPELRVILARPWLPGLPYGSPRAFSAALELSDAALPRADVGRIVSALAPVGVGESAIAEALRTELPPHALSELELGMLAAWQAARDPSLSWVPFCVAELGGSRIVRALASAHRTLSAKRDGRALDLLDALARSPSELARFELGRVAEGEHAAARARARRLLEPLARIEGISVERLIERSVPSLDLDARGERPIEGAEGWTLMVTSTLGVTVRDPAGSVLTELRGKASAPMKGAASALEAEVRAVATRAAKRLERAMCDARPLSPDVVMPMIAHPVLRRVVQTLVWQDARGERFRIAEDGTAATSEDEARPLPIEPVRIAHPVVMPVEERSAWRSLFESYELLPPFAQLDRPVHVASETERALLALTSRFFATRVHTLLARGFRLDWGTDRLEKALPDGLTLLVELSPGFDPRTSAREQGELDAVVSVHRDQERLTMGALDPAVLSELWQLMPPRGPQS